MHQDKKGYVGSIRQNALRLEKLGAQERHGKRLDDTSAMRRVRDEPPLVWGSLDLSEVHALHMQGVQRTRGAKTACIHAFVQFPTALINPNDYRGQYAMLTHAVRFMNRFHGNDAVFAARLDRDERGQHGVDVFLMPRYIHTYKDGRAVTKASPSKFAKEQAKARFFKEDKAGRPLLDKRGRRIPRDDVRAQGSALQDAWYEYLRNEMQLDRVQPPERKALSSKDRLDPEAYGLMQDRRKFEADRQEQMFSLSKMARQQTTEWQGIERARASIARDARVLRNLQVAAGGQVSRALDDLTEVRENER